MLVESASILFASVASGVILGTAYSVFLVRFRIWNQQFLSELRPLLKP